MNFFGHAAVASWRGGDPAFVLGAMLPDFAAMSGARLGPIAHPALAAGVACHHATDAVFHRSPAFRALCAAAVRELDARGVSRGAARGAAHVGIELLLDGVLTGDVPTCAAYLDALDACPSLSPHIAWSSGDHRWSDLYPRLRAAGVPTGYRDPRIVADRLTRILSRRPLLAPAPGDHAALAAWLSDFRPRVASAAPGLLRALGPR